MVSTNMMRRRLSNLWTPRSCTAITTTTSDSPFMEDYSSEDYDEDYDDVVPSNDPISIPVVKTATSSWEMTTFAPEVPNAVGTEEGKDCGAPFASLPLSIPVVKTATSWEMTMTVPSAPFHQCPEYLSVEMLLSSAALFVLQDCRTTIKSWIERFLSQLERLGIRFYSALRTLIRKPFVWASRKQH